jgi:hypothetical protein
MSPLLIGQRRQRIGLLCLPANLLLDATKLAVQLCGDRGSAVAVLDDDVDDPVDRPVDRNLGRGDPSAVQRPEQLLAHRHLDPIADRGSRVCKVPDREVGPEGHSDAFEHEKTRLGVTGFDPSEM